MTTNHIDQLTEWWENAEVPTRATLPNDGDRIIIRYNSEWYEVATSDGDAAEHEITTDTRILSRAPKPKPAWHDSVAVIAHTDDLTRSAWVRSVADQWETIDGYVAYSDDLRDVTPLIEAKVTDEMVKRGRDIGVKGRKPDAELVRRVLTAALGLESA